PASDAFVIQVIPHGNGEVFLSKRAADQDPGFFGLPFTGLTNPKKKTNPPYPQRDPDPVVDIFVYDAEGNLSLSKAGFGLNTVFYDSKSEIRVTLSPDLLRGIAARSIMVWRRSTEGRDY